MAYAPEQKVSYKGMSMPATIISGPHSTYGADRWLIRKADGMVTLAREAELTEIKDRRTRVAEALFESLSATGRFNKPFDSLVPAAKRQYLSAADKVIAALGTHLAPEASEGNFWVELTPEEAGMLHALLGSAVSGPLAGPRAQSDSVLRKLESIHQGKVQTAATRARRLMGRRTGGQIGVHFAGGA